MSASGNSTPPPPGPNASGKDTLGEGDDDDALSDPSALAREIMRLLKGKPPAPDSDDDDD